MQSIYPQLTPQQREAVLGNRHSNTTLTDEDIRDELSKGIAALEAGERVSWEPERIKQDGRRRLAVET